MGKYIDSGAALSPCGRYRYLLWREWRGTHDPQHWRWLDRRDGFGEPKACVFIMLNPSTADAEHDDPTIRRCVAFAQAWNFERLEVVNLFAHRATDPAALLALNDADNPVGPENHDYIENAVTQAGLVVCAWGAHGTHLGQDETVLGWCDGVPVHCLGITKGGHPRHPLYLPRDAKPTRFRPTVSENSENGRASLE